MVKEVLQAIGNFFSWKSETADKRNKVVEIHTKEYKILKKAMIVAVNLIEELMLKVPGDIRELKSWKKIKNQRKKLYRLLAKE